MKEFRFKKIDAFATSRSEGNPAGYIQLDSFSDISDSEMLRIAKELKGFVSEVGYLVNSGDNEFQLKYYSSEREVDFCGHATIAIMYNLISDNLSLYEQRYFQIKTNRGILNVENRIADEDAVFIEAPSPYEKSELPETKGIAKALKIAENEINLDLPVSIINAGLTTLLVPIKNLKSILSIYPDLDELKEFCIRSGVDIIEVFTDDVSESSNDYRTRVFAPTFGYLEDKATGSGNSAFGYYLLKNDIWKKEVIVIEQNESINSYNVVKLQKQAYEENKYRVYFGGGAVTRIEGVYKL